MRDAAAAEFLWMMRIDEAISKVYVFDIKTRSVHHPSPDELAWPGLLLLGKYHRQRIFPNKAPPKVKNVIAAFHDFANKCKNKANNPEWKSMKPYWKPRPGQFVPASNPELEYCLGRIQQILINSAVQSSKAFQVI